MGASSSERMYFDKCRDSAGKLEDAWRHNPELRGEIEPLMASVFEELGNWRPAFDATNLKASLKDLLYARTPKLALRIRRLKRACRRFGG
jgi:hypothetical protein